MKRVIVFSPSIYSLYTISVLNLLEKENIEVAAIVVRRLINPGRFFQEFRRDGKRLLYKIYRKLILRKTGFKTKLRVNICTWMKEEGIVDRSVLTFARRKQTSVLKVKTFNDTAVHHLLEEKSAACVLFTGGGLIGQKTLSLSGQGILNCHAGILPRYRGMDVVEWPILEDRINQVGMTVHLMDVGLDTGPVLDHKFIHCSQYSSFEALRNYFELSMPSFLVQSCILFLGGELQSKAQDILDGRQYFRLHTILFQLAKNRLLALSGNEKHVES